MNTLFLDIETLPADDKNEASMEALKAIYDRRVSKKALSEGEEYQTSFEDFVKGTSFDGGFGRILCIALAVNDDDVKVYSSATSAEGSGEPQWDEKKVLENFWKIAGQCDTFVGHNVLDFDLRFIWQRSIVLGVKPTWQDTDMRAPRYLSFARYRSSPVFDTMHEWVKWGRGSIGLEHVALSLGVPSPKDGIDGSQVAEFYNKGEVKKICDYCKRDVDTTRAIYKKMIFES
jgi:predicted PolB exonuclease-like 3'-5' exonuclease